MAAALISGAAAGVSGQRLPPPRFAPASASAVPPAPPLRGVAPEEEAAPTSTLVLGGVAGGAVGGLVGGFTGYLLGGGGKLCGDDACGSFGAVLGILLGESSGMGVGVNVADGTRGNGLLDVLGALGAGVVGLSAAGGTRSGAVLVLLTAAQLGAAVGIERASAH